jgi:mono/diheme cytochrome c family protein
MRPLTSLRLVVMTILACALLLILGAGAVICSGWYNVGAAVQHWQPVYTLLEFSMQRSVQNHAAGTMVPPLTQELGSHGAGLYRSYCLACHGDPGIAPDRMGRSMQPVPGPLAAARRRWKPSELHWIIRNGIKMSGMPAWEFHLSDAETWALVAYLQYLPETSPTKTALVTSANSEPLSRPENSAPVKNLERGRNALAQYGCRSCHVIPGVSGSQVQVGPALQGLNGRSYIAGYLPNTNENLVRWIRTPKAIKPNSAMPDLEVTQQDAEDMAAYLRSLEK